MAACPRCKIIDESQPGTYHCFNSFVQQMMLLKSIDRKKFLRRLIVLVSSIFGIDLLSYAVMSSHFHVVLRNRPDRVAKWSDEEILRRAMMLFPDTFKRKNLLAKDDEPLDPQLLNDAELIQKWRKRLSSISWLMKVVQERLSRHLNQERGTRGTIWEGRFKSVRLESEPAVVACIMYVELNAIRAQLADRPEESQFTSLYDRILGLTARRNNESGAEYDGFLAPINVYGDYENEDLAVLGLRASNDGCLELPLEKFIDMVDRIGRLYVEGKRGAIPDDLKPIFERIGIQPEFVCELIDSYDKLGRRIVGTVEAIRAAAKNQGAKYHKGVGQAQRFFVSTTTAAS